MPVIGAVTLLLRVSMAINVWLLFIYCCHYSHGISNTFTACRSLRWLHIVGYVIATSLVIRRRLHGRHCH